MKTADELWEFLEQARTLPHGAAQIALVEQMLPHVDAAGDPDLAFTTRLLATNAYVYGGEPAKAFVSFSWCVSDFDRNPGPHHQPRKHTLLWQFKAMVYAMTNFPEIPLSRTRAVLDDMERRYREDGNRLQAVYKHRYLVAQHVGELTEADRWYERWQAAPRDSLSDCIGCDPSSVADYLNRHGRHAEVVELAEPVLAGELTCTEQPQGILRELSVAYLKTGRPADAADAHRRSYRLERNNLADLWNIGTQIKFCALTGNENRGLEIFQRHVDWLDKAPSPASAMHFAADSALLLRRLTEMGHGEATIRRRQHGETTAAKLAAELAAQATELALRFDARNGTDHQSRLIAADLSAEPYEVELVLSPTARRAATVPGSAESGSAESGPAESGSADPGPADPGPAESGPVIPAESSPAELLDLAKEYLREDHDAGLAATLDALDARYPELTDPLLAGRRAVLRGDQLRLADRDGVVEAWTDAAELFAAAVAAGQAGAAGPASALRGRTALERAYAGEIDDAPIEADVAYQDEHGGPAERAGAWARLSLVRFLQERYDEANEAGDRSDAYAEQAGRPRLVAMNALVRARNRAALDRNHEALTAARIGWEFFREHGPERRRAEAATVYGQLAEDPAERAEMFGHALAGGARGPALAARLGRARALVQLDRAGDAIADLVEAVALCAEQDLDDGGVFTRQELANAYRLAGRPVEAAEVAEEALLGFERLGHDDPANDTRFLLAGLYRQIGDDDGALTIYRDLIGRLSANPAGRGQIGEQAGGLLFDLDRDAEAAEVFRSAAEDLREAGDPIGELRVLRRRLAALHFADDVAAGEEVIRLAAERYAALPAELAAEPTTVWQYAMIAFETGRLLMFRGRAAEALPYLRGAPERLRAIGAVDDADRLGGMLGEALLRSGSPAEAEALLRALLAGMAPDAPGREVAATVYAEAQAALNGS
jgi:hypothetical protein